MHDKHPHTGEDDRGEMMTDVIVETREGRRIHFYHRDGRNLVIAFSERRSIIPQRLRIGPKLRRALYLASRLEAKRRVR